MRRARHGAASSFSQHPRADGPLVVDEPWSEAQSQDPEGCMRHPRNKKVHVRMPSRLALAWYDAQEMYKATTALGCRCIET